MGLGLVSLETSRFPHMLECFRFRLTRQSVPYWPFAGWTVRATF